MQLRDTTSDTDEATITLRDERPVPLAPHRKIVVQDRSLWLGLALLGPVGLAALLGSTIAPADPFDSVAPPFQAPSLAHPFGTDDLGRDLLSAVIHGARTSLLVGCAVAALALFLGLAVGVIAGFSRSWIDDAFMRVTEFFQVVPRFFLAILVLALFGNSLANLVVVLALTSWGGLARIARAEVLSLREYDFVRAARALGANPWRIAVRHVVPNAVPSLLPLTALLASGAILTEAGMSYLGLGDPNRMSLGYLLNNAQSFLYRAWWLSAFPGLAMVATVLGLAIILDRLR
jgi:peptide/nickel transport system permease protein